MKHHAQNSFGTDGCCSLWQHQDFPFGELSLSLDDLEALNSPGGSEDSSVDDSEPHFTLANENILNDFKDVDQEISKFIKSESPPFENLIGCCGL